MPQKEPDKGLTCNLDDPILSILPVGGYYSHEVRLCPGANPIVDDIFVEVDYMGGKDTDWGKVAMGYVSGGGLCFGFFGAWDAYSSTTCDGHKMTSDAKDKVISAFAAQGIRLHIDDGSMGGGRQMN